VSYAERLDPSPQYEPLGSVWYGEEDAELLERLLLLYPRARIGFSMRQSTVADSGATVRGGS
jgi:hypothetical protein